jgi:hypothetical protein
VAHRLPSSREISDENDKLLEELRMAKEKNNNILNHLQAVKLNAQILMNKMEG